MKVVAHIRLSLATGYCFIQQPSTASMHIALYLRSNHMLEDFVPAASEHIPPTGWYTTDAGCL